MKKIIIFILLISFCATCFGALGVNSASAALNVNWKNDLQNVGQPAYGPGDPNLMNTVGKVIQIALGFIGVIMLVLFIYGGFLWMTSAGSEDKITKAKGIIKAAVIGLAIVLIAYSATYFVMEKLVETV